MAPAAFEQGGTEAPGPWQAAWLFRGISLSIQWRKLLLSALGVVLLLSLTETLLPTHGRVPANPAPPGVSAWLAPLPRILAPLAEVTRLPRQLISAASPGQPRPFWPALLTAVGFIAIGGFLGCALARMTLVQLATNESPGLRTALQFSTRKLAPLLLAPLGTLGAFLFLGGLLALAGLLFRLGGSAGNIAVGLVLPLALLIGLTMTWILIALVAGWPLMVASIAAENDDTFDAISRSLSYVFQRPLRYLTYLAVAILAGLVGLALVALLYHLTISITSLGLSLAAPGSIGPDPLATTTNQPGARLIAAWTDFAGLLAGSWIFSFFWCAFAQIYLLLRHDVDGTPLDDIDLPGDELQPFAPQTNPAPTEAPPAPAAASALPAGSNDGA